MKSGMALKNREFTPESGNVDTYVRHSDLERLLRDSQSARMRLLVTDGVFSMDGNVAPLR